MLRSFPLAADDKLGCYVGGRRDGPFWKAHTGGYTTEYVDTATVTLDCLGSTEESDVTPVLASAGVFANSGSSSLSVSGLPRKPVDDSSMDDGPVSRDGSNRHREVRGAQSKTRRLRAKATSGNQKTDMKDELAVKGKEQVVGVASSGSEQVDGSWSTAGESSVKSRTVIVGSHRVPISPCFDGNRKLRRLTASPADGQRLQDLLR